MLHRDDRLVVEIVPDREMVWDPLAAFIEVLVGGNEIVRIDEEGTTRPCSCGPDRQIRLVLRGVRVSRDRMTAVIVYAPNDVLRITL